MKNNHTLTACLVFALACTPLAFAGGEGDGTNGPAENITRKTKSTLADLTCAVNDCSFEQGVIAREKYVKAELEHGSVDYRAYQEFIAQIKTLPECSNLKDSDGFLCKIEKHNASGALSLSLVEKPIPAHYYINILEKSLITDSERTSADQVEIELSHSQTRTALCFSRHWLISTYDSADSGTIRFLPLLHDPCQFVTINFKAVRWNEWTNRIGPHLAGMMTEAGLELDPNNSATSSREILLTLDDATESRLKSAIFSNDEKTMQSWVKKTLMPSLRSQTFQKLRESVTQRFLTNITPSPRAIVEFTLEQVSPETVKIGVTIPQADHCDGLPSLCQLKNTLTHNGRYLSPEMYLLYPNRLIEADPKLAYFQKAIARMIQLKKENALPEARLSPH